MSPTSFTTDNKVLSWMFYCQKKVIMPSCSLICFKCFNYQKIPKSTQPSLIEHTSSLFYNTKNLERTVSKIMNPIKLLKCHYTFGIPKLQYLNYVFLLKLFGSMLISKFYKQMSYIFKDMRSKLLSESQVIK